MTTPLPKWDGPSPTTATSNVEVVAISIEDLQAIAARARAKAEAAGDLNPTGPTHVELPQSVRKAIGEALRSGEYEQAARQATVGG